MIDASWIKRHIKDGNIAPIIGVTKYDPSWDAPKTRTLWTGVIEQCRVSFYPKGREIDMSTVHVTSAGKFEGRE